MGFGFHVRFRVIERFMIGGVTLGYIPPQWSTSWKRTWNMTRKLGDCNGFKGYMTVYGHRF